MKCICKLPKKMCVCSKPEEIARINGLIKKYCVDCGNLIDIPAIEPLERYFMRGNYCARCNINYAPGKYFEGEEPRRTYKDYLRASGYKVKEDKKVEEDVLVGVKEGVDKFEDVIISINNKEDENKNISIN